MFRFAVVCAVLAMACAAPAPGIGLQATLLPRVAVAPATTTIVRQPIVVDHPEPIYRSVPVPVAYASPIITSHSVIAAPTHSVLAAPSLYAANPWASSLII